MKYEIFVINLARAAERRADISARLHTAGVDFEIVDAVDGKKLDMNSIADRLTNALCRKFCLPDLRPAEVGCFLSHYNLYKRIADEEIPAALILEDDAVWEDDFFTTVGEVVASKYYWNIVQLAGKKPLRVVSEIDNFGKRKLVRYNRFGATAAGYLIDLDGAKKMLNFCYEIRGNIDWQWHEIWKSKVYFYHIHPPLVTHDTKNSYIGYSESFKKPKTHRKLAIGQWRWFVYRQHRQLAKKFFQLTHPRKLRK